MSNGRQRTLETLIYGMLSNDVRRGYSFSGFELFSHAEVKLRNVRHTTRFFVNRPYIHEISLSSYTCSLIARYQRLTETVRFNLCICYDYRKKNAVAIDSNKLPAINYKINCQYM